MVERITTLMTAQMTISDLNQAMDRLNATQEELSSGKRINRPSDDPYGTSLALQLQGELAGFTAYSRNIDDGTAWVRAGEAALTNIGNMVQRVRELTVEAANGTNTQSDLNAAANEVDQLIAAIKQEADASYNGQYIFSGTATTTAPYQSGSADAYQGNSSAIQREIGPGTTLQVNVDLSQLLGSGQPAADDRLLDVLRNISQDMKAGNIAALGGADLQGLDANENTLTQMQADLGATADRLQLASSRLQDLQVSRTQILSNVQDADMAQTEIDYSTEQAAFTAALRASANIVQSSLLDFLK